MASLNAPLLSRLDGTLLRACPRCRWLALILTMHANGLILVHAGQCLLFLAHAGRRLLRPIVAAGSARS